MLPPWSRPSDDARSRVRSLLPRRATFALAATLALVAVACGAHPLHTKDVADSEDAGSSGIAVDPVSQLPKAADVAHPVDSVATLRTPIPDEVVRSIVHRLFESFQSRSVTPMHDDLDDKLVDLMYEQQQPTPREVWAETMDSRMKGAPFNQLDVDQMYRSQDVEVYAREELGQPGRPPRPSSMDPDDLLVRIPILTTRLGADDLFGDEIRLLLRRDGSRYVIRAYGENAPK